MQQDSAIVSSSPHGVLGGGHDLGVDTLLAPSRSWGKCPCISTKALLLLGHPLPCVQTTHPSWDHCQPQPHPLQCAFSCQDCTHSIRAPLLSLHSSTDITSVHYYPCQVLPIPRSSQRTELRAADLGALTGRKVRPPEEVMAKCQGPQCWSLSIHAESRPKPMTVRCMSGLLTALLPPENRFCPIFMYL